jgi:cytoskeletal protein RodZ
MKEKQVKLSDEAQEQEFKDIGEYLRQAREAKSISIDEIAINTRIRPDFLIAMEEGRASDLPEAVYIQGFIRRYCDVIGIDGTPIASKFGDLFLTVEKYDENTNIEKKSNLYIPLAVPYILLLITASFGLFYTLSPHRSSKPVAQQTTLSTATKPASSPSPTATPVISSSSVLSPIPTPTTSPIATSTSTPTVTPTSIPTAIPTPTSIPTPLSNSKVEVGIELQGKSWVRVKVDGKTEFEGELEKGHKQTWTGTKEVIIRSGNAGAILVSANKKPPVQMGANDDVKQIVYTPEAVPSPQVTP